MKNLKKASLMVLAVIVFTYTSFALEISNSGSQNKFIGKSENVRLITAAEASSPNEKKLTPLAVIVVVAIVAISISPAWFAGPPPPPPPPPKKLAAANAQILQLAAMHNLD